MTGRNKFNVAAIAAVLGALIASAFAQNGASSMQSPSNDGMTMGYMGEGMMPGDGTMSVSMMAGCAGMMQSMNSDGNSKPNSQWQKHPPGAPDNGG